MPTMEELYSNPDLFLEGTQVVSESDFSNLKEKVKAWARGVVDGYTKYGKSLNEQIASIASQNNLNNETISRIIEEVNTEVYLQEYGKKKKQLTRDVEFEIADLNKIKDMLGNSSSANTETVENANKEDGSMQKAASANQKSDPLNAFNYKSHTVGSMELKSRYSREDILKSEITEKIASEIKSIEDNRKVLEKNIRVVADAMLKYASHGIDMPRIFESMCKDAELQKTSQIFIKHAYDERVKSLKSVRKLPEAFNAEINLVDGLVKEAEFSLGKNSLNKNEKPKEEVPAVVADDELVEDYKALVNVALNIKDKQEKALEEAKRQSELEQKLTAVKA